MEIIEKNIARHHIHLKMITFTGFKQKKFLNNFSFTINPLMPIDVYCCHKNVILFLRALRSSANYSGHTQRRSEKSGRRMARRPDKTVWLGKNCRTHTFSKLL